MDLLIAVKGDGGNLVLDIVSVSLVPEIPFDGLDGMRVVAEDMLGKLRVLAPVSRPF